MTKLFVVWSNDKLLHICILSVEQTWQIWQVWLYNIQFPPSGALLCHRINKATKAGNLSNTSFHQVKFNERTKEDGPLNGRQVEAKTSSQSSDAIAISKSETINDWFTHSPTDWQVLEDAIVSSYLIKKTKIKIWLQQLHRNVSCAHRPNKYTTE